MGCSLMSLKGIGDFCGTNLAGIKEAWLGQHSDFVVTPEKDSKGEAINSVATIAKKEGATDGKLYHYAFAKQTGSLTSTITIDEANGVRYYTNEVNLQFNKLEAGKHAEIEALAAGKLIGIIHDNNDEFWLVGWDGYLSATAVTAQTGQAYGDHNGYETTMSAMSAKLPLSITEEQFEALKDTDTEDDL